MADQHINVGGIIVDLVAGAGIVLLMEFISWRYTLPFYDRGKLWFYAATATAIWVARDLGVIPQWLSSTLFVIVVIAYIFGIASGPRGGGRRRKAGATRLRVKQWLARGVPAKRPAAQELRNG